MRLLDLLGFTQPKSDVETIELDGPFLQEDHLVKKYKCGQNTFIKNIYKQCNLIISRDLLVFTSDYKFSPRDNFRLELGLKHHIHNFELSFRNDKDYEILAIDQFIMLNPSDKQKTKEYLDHHLPTEEELKRQHLLNGQTYVCNRNS